MKFTLGVAALVCSAGLVRGEDWPQFRGPGGRGISEKGRPPLVFGPETNLVWRAATPIGNSSPIVAGSRVFITAAEANRLEVICFSLEDGSVLWRREAAELTIPSSMMNDAMPATPTPATDGKMVYASFGYFGVVAYDMEGKEQWRRTVAEGVAQRGVSASPILIGDRLVSVFDQSEGSYMEALDKTTGEVIWRTDRAKFKSSYATPFHWSHAKREELVVQGALWLTSYDPATGKEIWRSSGSAQVAWSTPTASGDILFSASASLAWREDKPQEAKPLFDSGGLLAGVEWMNTDVLPKPGKGMRAVQACGSGDITKSHLIWESERSSPGASSPVFYRGRLFTMKDGGFVSAYDGATGKAVFQEERISAPGNYFASAVAADGRVYFISQRGLVTVMAADGAEPMILAQNKLGEETFATPAIAGDAIVVRTEKALYRFGQKP